MLMFTGTVLFLGVLRSTSSLIALHSLRLPPWDWEMPCHFITTRAWITRYTKNLLLFHPEKWREGVHDDGPCSPPPLPVALNSSVLEDFPLWPGRSAFNMLWVHSLADSVCTLLSNVLYLMAPLTRPVLQTPIYRPVVVGSWPHC